MRFRRIVMVVLLVGLIGAVFPGVGEAGVHDGGRLAGIDQGFIARVVELVQSVFAALTDFVATEGAMPTSNG